MSKAADKRRRMARLGLESRRARRREEARLEARELARKAEEVRLARLREDVLWSNAGPPRVEPPPWCPPKPLIVPVQEGRESNLAPRQAVGMRPRMGRQSLAAIALMALAFGGLPGVEK